MTDHDTTVPRTSAPRIAALHEAVRNCLYSLRAVEEAAREAESGKGTASALVDGYAVARECLRAVARLGWPMPLGLASAAGQYGRSLGGGAPPSAHYGTQVDLWRILRQYTEPIDKLATGAYPKYIISRTDGKPVDRCFVLELRDPLAVPALHAYRDAARAAGYAALAVDLDHWLNDPEYERTLDAAGETIP